MYSRMCGVLMGWDLCPLLPRSFHSFLRDSQMSKMRMLSWRRGDSS